MYIIYKAMNDKVEYLQEFFEDLKLPIYTKYKIEAKEIETYDEAYLLLEKVRLFGVYTNINMRYIRD